MEAVNLVCPLRREIRYYRQEQDREVLVKQTEATHTVAHFAKCHGERCPWYSSDPERCGWVENRRDTYEFKYIE